MGDVNKARRRGRPPKKRINLGQLPPALRDAVLAHSALQQRALIRRKPRKGQGGAQKEIVRPTGFMKQHLENLSIISSNDALFRVFADLLKRQEYHGREGEPATVKEVIELTKRFAEQQGIPWAAIKRK